MIILIGEGEKQSLKQKALEIISKCVNCNIDKIDYLESGKPVINNGYISISHTENLVVIAYSKSEVGVDVENINRQTKIEGISIKDWTQIEAYYKKIGTGISLSKINKNIPLIDIQTIEYKNYYISVSSEDNEIFLTFI